MRQVMEFVQQNREAINRVSRVNKVEAIKKLRTMFDIHGEPVPGIPNLFKPPELILTHHTPLGLYEAKFMIDAVTDTIPF